MIQLIEDLTFESGASLENDVLASCWTSRERCGDHREQGGDEREMPHLEYGIGRRGW